MLTFIQPFDSDDSFPALSRAEKEPNGLLAIGGDLSPSRLLTAYQQGIFPWFDEGQPILWWSPEPRMVLYPNEFHISKSLKKNIRKFDYHYSFDQAFRVVINACAAPRKYSDNTWINKSMIEAYNKLHELGHAHSVEIWKSNKLVGGLYGLAIGKIFFGESMFSINTDASKSAFMALCAQLHNWGFHFIDCQLHSDHLQRLGAKEISREVFLNGLTQYCNIKVNHQWNIPLQPMK